MFSGFLTILQFIWPFFKEALFGNGTFKVWLRSNYMTVLWFVMMMIMLLMVLALSNMLKNAEADLAQTQSAIVKYREATLTYQKTNAELLADNTRLRNEAKKAKKDPPPHDSKHPQTLPTVHVRPPAHDRATENNSILQRLHTH